MLVGIGLGMILSVLILIGLIKITLREDPTGCIVLFSVLIFLVVWSGLIARWLIFGG